MISVDLNGVWRLGWQDARRGDRAFAADPAPAQSTWFDATVPGEVHRTLEDLGIIENIENGLGALGAEWIERMTWLFVRDIDIEQDWLDGTGRAELVFERLELGARVFVNESLVAEHCTAFHPLRVDVRNALRVGSNRIRVELDSGAQHVADLPTIGTRRSVAQGPSKRQWLRTPQSQFTWDWSPHLVTIGITEPARIEFSRHPVRIEAVVPVVALSAALDSAVVTCGVVVVADEPATVSIAVGIDELGSSQRQTFEIGAGESRLDVALAVDAPELWWPIGLGEQKRYELDVTMTTADGLAVEDRSILIGFRSAVVDQSPAPDGGTLFRLVINGQPFFARGANWVPLSLTPRPVDVPLLETQLDRAIAANMNFLRVWGGGDYESAEFYNACDERGIVVWQDLAFACIRYPVEEQWFRDKLKDEVRYQVRRLSPHPSLVLWAGDNENAWIGQADVWPGPLVPRIDGVTEVDFRRDHLFWQEDLAAVVREEDASRFYWPSSPWSPSGADHNSPSEGDQHPWDIGFENVDFRQYRTTDARFPNEGGMLGPSTLPAMLESLPQGMRAYESFAWKIHDNQTAQTFPSRPMEALLRDWTGQDIRALSLEEYVYWTGLLHGEALTEYVDTFRRRSDTIGSAVFWMYNDCWPTVRSWSVVDHAGRRMPSYYPVARAFDPVRVIVVESEGGGFRVHACNDTRSEIVVDVEFGCVALSGAPTELERRSVSIPPLSTVVIGDGVLDRQTRLTHVAIATLSIDGTVRSRSRLIGAPYRELVLTDPTIEVVRDASGVTLRSDAYVLGVCLDLTGTRDLSDNFFDLFPNVPYTVRCSDDEPLGVLFDAHDCLLPASLPDH